MEAVRDLPSYRQTLPMPTSGGVLLQYRADILPGAKWVMDDCYLPLLRRGLETAEIPLVGEITHFHMNDIETFRRLFSRSLSEDDIRRRAKAAGDRQ